MGSRRSALLVVAATVAALSFSSVAIARPGAGRPKPTQKHGHGTTTTTTSSSTSTTTRSTTTTTGSTTTTTAPATPLPTPTAADGVGPGDWIEITQGSQTFGCTANFVWVDAAGNHYLGTAGHCLLPQPDPITGQGGMAEATTARLATIDTDIQICTASCAFGGQAGFLLDGTVVGKLVDLGPAGFYARQYPDGKPDALGDDFALIRLPAGMPLRPGVPVWGGPTGTGSLTAGGMVCLYGNGEGVGEAFPTKARSGIGMGVQPDGNGGPPSWYADIPSFEGDSGSAVVNCELGPNGLVGTTAVGLLTDLVVGDTPGVVEGTTVAQAIAMTFADTGVRISLVMG
jgi:hypothetical protein